MYRFCFNHLLESDKPLTFYGEPVRFINQAEYQMNLIANYTLHLHKENLMEDHSNYGWIESNNHGEWLEVDEDELDNQWRE